MYIPKLRDGKRYFEWRENVYKRDGYKCQTCGTTEKIVPHHIIEWDDAPELRLDVENGLTLCISCHMRHHSKLKSNLPEEHVVPWNKGLKGLTIGTKKGAKFSDEHRLKLSEAKKGRKFSEAHRKNLIGCKSEKSIIENRERFKGKTWKLDPETKKRIWIIKV